MKYLGYALIAALAGLIQTLSGFGSAAIMVLFLEGSFGMLAAPAIATSINLGLTSTLAFRYRRFIEWKKILIPAVVYVAVNILVISAARSLQLMTIKKAFGVFLIVLAVYSLFFSEKKIFTMTKRTLFVFSVFSGVFGGLFSVGGPLLAMYYSAVSDSKEAYIADLQFIFLLTCITGTLTRILEGIYTLDLVPVTLAGLVGINVGKTLGLRIVNKLDRRVIFIIVYVYVAFSGLMILL